VRRAGGGSAGPIRKKTKLENSEPIIIDGADTRGSFSSGFGVSGGGNASNPITL
jgi:hypothetical protein